MYKDLTVWSSFPKLDLWIFRLVGINTISLLPSFLLDPPNSKKVNRDKVNSMPYGGIEHTLYSNELAVPLFCQCYVCIFLASQLK